MNNDTLHRDTWAPATPEDRLLVTSTLEEILSSAPFRSSRRYPAMLRYIVEKTITNQHSDLKERTIGIEVFGRNPGYDTNADPVVRFSAGEIRRRLAQFYQESGTASTIVLELPSGTYIPRIHLRPQTLQEHLDQEAAATAATIHETEAGHEESAARPHAEAPHKRRWLPVVLAAVVIACCGAGLLVWRSYYSAHADPVHADPVMDVWAPMLISADPVLISAGRPLPESGDPPEVPNMSIGDHILRPEFRVSIATLDAIANIVSYLKSRQKPFRIHEANSNTLADLHDRPVVLVTGNNNKWTVLLLKPLRFHFVQQGQFSYIEDSQNPSAHNWSVDFTKPYREQTTDYAIVSRFYNSTTGGPIVVVAGISSNGTEAAGEFIVSPEALAKLAKSAPGGTLNGNFEAVLKVEVVDGNTGAATVVASQFW